MSAAQYVYASAKLRALEPKILDATDIERMVDAPDFTTAFKVLNDTDYADNLLDKEPAQYRDALREDYVQMHKLLYEITPDINLLKLVYLERDFLTIRMLLKAKYFNKLDEIQPLLRDDTIHDKDKLVAYITEGVDNGLRRRFKIAITHVLERLPEQPTPAQIDIITTQEMYRLKLHLAKKIGSDTIASLIKTQIDNANILMAIRAKRQGIDRATFESYCIFGGTISHTDIIGKYEEELTSFQSLISARYDTSTASAFQQLLDNDTLYPLEKALDDFLTKQAQQIKFVSYGPEVVYAYFLAKHIAVQNIRLILAGKFNSINAEEIKKTLRLSY